MDIHIGKVVRLKPLNGACQRTKNRIREHGDQGFKITKFDPGSWLFGGTPAMLLTSVACASAGQPEWAGWLPLLEIGEDEDND